MKQIGSDPARAVNSRAGDLQIRHSACQFYALRCLVGIKDEKFVVHRNISSILMLALREQLLP